MSLTIATVIRPMLMTGSARHHIHTIMARKGLHRTFSTNGDGYMSKNGDLYVYNAEKARRYVRRHDKNGKPIKNKVVRPRTVWNFYIYKIPANSGVTATQTGRTFTVSPKNGSTIVKY